MTFLHLISTLLYLNIVQPLPTYVAPVPVTYTYVDNDNAVHTVTETPPYVAPAHPTAEQINQLGQEHQQEIEQLMADENNFNQILQTEQADAENIVIIIDVDN